MIFETHAHYNSSRFDEDRQTLLSSMRDHGIGWIVNIAAEHESFQENIDLAEKYPDVYYTIGIHPDEIIDLSRDVLDEIATLADAEKCLAIGEIGLDYFRTSEQEAKENQHRWFRDQLDIAVEKDLPVVIHSRDACKDTMDILGEYAGKVICDLHCYAYSPEIALEYVKMGFYIGVGGVVTFKNARSLVDTVEAIPLSHILLETDCPYLAPHPFRGERNDSTYLPYVIKRIAEIKGITEDEVTEVTTGNARKFYRI